MLPDGSTIDGRNPDNIELGFTAIIQDPMHKAIEALEKGEKTPMTLAMTVRRIMTALRFRVPMDTEFWTFIEVAVRMAYERGYAMGKGTASESR